MVDIILTPHKGYYYVTYIFELILPCHVINLNRHLTHFLELAVNGQFGQ